MSSQTPQEGSARKYKMSDSVLISCNFGSVQVAYTDQERLIGESVRFQIKKNLKNTILFPTRFLGLNSECKE